jgi:hypothetical protein
MLFAGMMDSSILSWTKYPEITREQSESVLVKAGTQSLTNS